MLMRFLKHQLFLPLTLFFLLLSGGVLFAHFNSNSTSTDTLGKSYDVIVVGAGPGGIAASIQAAKMGVNVALLEPTDWIGGQMTAAGVGTMDEGSPAARQSGLYKDFVNRTRAYYESKHKSVNTCYYGMDSLCVDPQVGQQILRQMLQDAGPNLHVFTQTNVTKVHKQGDIVTGITANNKTISTKVVIDADEYGDILEQAGAEYRLGAGTSAQPDYDSCVQSITYSAVIKYYPDGIPESLKFQSAPPGYSPEIAKHFAAYLQKNGTDNLVTHTLSNMSLQSYTAFRGIPDLSNPNDYNVQQKDGHVITRTSLNLGNDYPLKGDLSIKYITDPSYRTKTTCEAKLLTLQLIYYIQHDMGGTWSVANDEGYDTAYNKSQHCTQLNGFESFENNLSTIVYTREARRLVGVDTLTGNEVIKARTDPTNAPDYLHSIAVGYYPMDLHACHEPLEKGLDSSSNLSAKFASNAFEVPLGILIPKKLDGLLAAEKNISVSRQANGAIREQPIAMDIGQAAGALAALSAKQHKPPRNVPYSDVKQALDQAGVTTQKKPKP
jgi:hypothetical protein